MLNRISLAVAVAAFALAFAGPASAECGSNHQQTVKLPTVTAQGTTAPTTPAPQTPVPGAGG